MSYIIVAVLFAVAGFVAGLLVGKKNPSVASPTFNNVTTSSSSYGRFASTAESLAQSAEKLAEKK